jgi:hypothetical protein
VLINQGFIPGSTMLDMGMTGRRRSSTSPVREFGSNGQRTLRWGGNTSIPFSAATLGPNTLAGKGET